MLDPETTAVVTGAAGNIVAYMLSGRVDALRAWIGRIFKAGSPAEQSLHLRTVEDDSSALARHLASEADIKTRWGVFLASYLAEHPEVRADIEELAASRSALTGTMNVSEQRNYSGTFVGRDNYGDITA